jgi:hypothetical protein
MLFLPVPPALNGDGNAHASSLGFVQSFRMVSPKVESNLRESVAKVGRQQRKIGRMTGFPPRYSWDFMTIFLSYSFDVLAFAPASSAAMEEGHE